MYTKHTEVLKVQCDNNFMASILLAVKSFYY